MLYVASTITSRTSLGFIKLKDSITAFSSVIVSVCKFSIVNTVLKFIGDSSCRLFVTRLK